MVPFSRCSGSPILYWLVCAVLHSGLTNITEFRIGNRKGFELVCRRHCPIGPFLRPSRNNKFSRFMLWDFDIPEFLVPFRFPLFTLRACKVEWPPPKDLRFRYDIGGPLLVLVEILDRVVSQLFRVFLAIDRVCSRLRPGLLILEVGRIRRVPLCIQFRWSKHHHTIIPRGVPLFHLLYISPLLDSRWSKC